MTEKTLVWMMFNPDGSRALSAGYDSEPPLGLRLRMESNGYTFRQIPVKDSHSGKQASQS